MCHRSRPFHFIINSWKLFLWSPCFHRVHVHYLLLIYKHDRLLLAWIIAYILLEFIYNFNFTCEKYDCREVFLSRLIILIFIWCLSCKTSIELHIINYNFKLVHTSRRSLAVIPNFDCTNCFRLIKNEAHIIWNAIICAFHCLCFLLGSCWSDSLIRSGIFKWCNPHVVFIECLILSID